MLCMVVDYAQQVFSSSLYLQLYRSTSLVGISNTSLSIARIAAMLKHRIAESPTRGGTAETALSTAFLEILLVATAELRKGEGKLTVHASFAYSRVSRLSSCSAFMRATRFRSLQLPEILRALFVKGGLADVPDGVSSSRFAHSRACLTFGLPKASRKSRERHAIFRVVDQVRRPGIYGCRRVSRPDFHPALVRLSSPLFPGHQTATSSTRS